MKRKKKQKKPTPSSVPITHQKYLLQSANSICFVFLSIKHLKIDFC